MDAFRGLASVTPKTVYADFRCGLAADFFAASFVGFLPLIAISISFWAAATFLAGFFGALVSAETPPTLRLSASIRSTTLLAAGRSFGVIGLPARFWLMRSTSALS
jgi:hypothetical protein